MFKLIDTRYRIDSKELNRKRLATRLTLDQFAKICGWSVQYQWQLEHNKFDTVSEATKNVIEDVFNQLV